MMNSTKTLKKIYLGCVVIIVAMVLISVILCRGETLGRLSVDYVRDIAVDIMGMLVCGIIFFGIYTDESDFVQNKAMFRLLFSLSILFFVDLLSAYFEDNSRYVLVVIIVNTITFIFEDLLGFAYWTYVRDEIKLGERFLSIANRICVIALGIDLFLDVLNMKVGIFFTVTEAGEYVDSPYEFIGDIAIITVFFVAGVSIIRAKEVNIREKLILMSFEIFPLITYLIASFTQKYTWIYPSYLLSVLLIYIRIFSKKEKKIAEQQVQLTKQGTALMISQIQPHFLYNVLTTISNLCATDPEEAEETTVLFSQYLRTNLDSLRSQEPVAFSKELQHIRTYVELEKKRFGDIINVEYDIKEQNFLVPALGLQPIVENSIKHGIRGKNEPGHIKISACKVENGYQVVIEDDGVGFDMNMPAKNDGKSHVGMTNVKERLRQMCNASVTIESSVGNGCRTEIFFPES